VFQHGRTEQLQPKHEDNRPFIVQNGGRDQIETLRQFIYPKRVLIKHDRVFTRLQIIGCLQTKWFWLICYLKDFVQRFKKLICNWQYIFTQHRCFLIFSQRNPWRWNWLELKMLPRDDQKQKPCVSLQPQDRLPRSAIANDAWRLVSQNKPQCTPQQFAYTNNL